MTNVVGDWDPKPKLKKATLYDVIVALSEAGLAYDLKAKAVYIDNERKYQHWRQRAELDLARRQRQVIVK